MRHVVFLFHRRWDTHLFWGGYVPLLVKNTKLVQRTELDCGHVDRIANWRLVVPGAGVFLWQGLQVCTSSPYP